MGVLCLLLHLFKQTRYSLPHITRNLSNHGSGLGDSGKQDNICDLQKKQHVSIVLPIYYLALKGLKHSMKSTYQQRSSVFMKLQFSYNWQSGYCIDPGKWRSLYWGMDKIRWCSGTSYGTSWRSTSATGTSSWSRSTRTQEREGRGCGRLSTRSPWSATCWAWRMRPSNTSAHTMRWVRPRCSRAFYSQTLTVWS